MNRYVSLDVSLKTVFICIINGKGKDVKEMEMNSIPKGIGGFLIGTGPKIAKISLESGNLTIPSFSLIKLRTSFPRIRPPFYQPVVVKQLP